MKRFLLLCAAAAIGSTTALIFHFGSIGPGFPERGSGRKPFPHLIANDEDPEPPPRRERTEIANDGQNKGDGDYPGTDRKDWRSNGD